MESHIKWILKLKKKLVVFMLWWEVLNRFDSEAAARASGAAETVDYFG